jgi:hypothetical protein
MHAGDFTCARDTSEGDHEFARISAAGARRYWFSFFRRVTCGDAASVGLRADHAGIAISACDLRTAFAQPAQGPRADSRSLAAIYPAAHNHRLPGASLLREGVTWMAPAFHPGKGVAMP